MPAKGIRIGKEEISYITLFEGLTGASVVDCIVDGKKNRVILVVKQGQAGLAIGHRGINLRRLKDMTGKHYEIVEYSDDLITFVKNVSRSIKPKEIRVIRTLDRKNTIMVVLNRRDEQRWRRGGYHWKLSTLTKRYFDIDRVQIMLS